MKLMGRMLCFILSPAVIGLMLLSAVGYWMAGGLITEQIRGDAAAILDAEVVGMDAVVGGLFESMIPFTQNARLRALATAWDKLDAAAKRNGVLQSLDNQLVKAGSDALRGFVDDSNMAYIAMLISIDGKVLAYSIDGQGDGLHKEIGEDYSSRPYFQACRDTGTLTQRTIISKSTGAISTMMARPLKIDGRTVGIIAVGIRNVAVSAMTMEKIKVGAKGHSYAYGYNGRIVLHHQPNRIGQDISATPLFAAMKKTPTGRMEIKDDTGAAKIVYWKSMPKEAWYLVLELDADEVLGPTHGFLRNMMCMGAGFGLIVGLIIFVMARGISGLVGGFSRITAAVAGGRLEESPEERTLLDKATMRKDEFQVMGQGMRTMMASLAKLIQESEEKTQAAEEATRKAEDATREAEKAAKRAEAAKSEGMHAAAEQLEGMVSAISAASSELSAQIEQSDRSAVESSQRLSEAATAMNEMNATVQEVARNASSAATVSAETRNNAEEGQKILSNAMASINQVQKVSMELKEDMSTLHGHTQNISQIMNVISDIADQTNLLALNAAIEAARAGEAGRGFAVVADEVRKLAEKTMASTNDVSQAITAIQSSAQQSVDRMEEALGNVEQATNLAQQSGEALQQIVRNVEDTADQVRAIATASEEQSAASEEINQSITTVNEMSSQTTQAMNEASKAIADLAQQTDRLSALIGDMKRA